MHETQHHERHAFLPVLVATHRTQGQRSTDFAAVDDGEIVTLASVCDRDRGRPDGGCGCTRTFIGVRGRTAITTAAVRGIARSRADYRDQLWNSACAAGFRQPHEDRTELDAQADELLDIAASWPIGTVLERRDDLLRVREWPPRLPKRTDPRNRS